MTEVTTDVILDTMRGWVEEKHPISPSVWVDASAKLNMFLGDERDKLFNLQQKVAQIKVDYLSEGDTSAKAKTKVEATDIYREMLTQKGRIEQITEFIRIAKLQARMSNDEIKNY